MQRRPLTRADHFTHFFFGDTVGATYDYLRRQQNYDWPVFDVTSLDLRCNLGGTTSGLHTATATVAPGSTVGFRSNLAAFHAGPFNAYLARAAGPIADFAGAGAVWFRIWSQGAHANPAGAGPLTWPLDQTSWSFAIPANTPPGDYLVRFEQIALHVAMRVGAPGQQEGAQFHMACAQIRVTGSATGACGGSGGSGVLTACRQPRTQGRVPRRVQGYRPECPGRHLHAQL